MRSALRSFLEWLDKRFPEKVVVTQAEYLKIQAKINNLETFVSKMVDEIPQYDERLKRIEAEINKFNVSLGFGELSTEALGRGRFKDEFSGSKLVFDWPSRPKTEAVAFVSVPGQEKGNSAAITRGKAGMVCPTIYGPGERSDSSIEQGIRDVLEVASPYPDED